MFLAAFAPSLFATGFVPVSPLGTCVFPPAVGPLVGVAELVLTSGITVIVVSSAIAHTATLPTLYASSNVANVVHTCIKFFGASIIIGIMIRGL
jgi:hypothetical protein